MVRKRRNGTVRTPPPEGTEAVTSLSRDLKKASSTLSSNEARFLVNSFYNMQNNRIRSMNQIRTLAENNEPHATLAWFADNATVLENSIENALDAYSKASVLGRWARSITGVGPIITAGLLAHIEMEPWRCAVSHEFPSKKGCNPKIPHGPRCKTIVIATAGSIWRFAGLDPTVTWEKGQKRPWNATLKTLVWKIGESFVKVSGNDNDMYGHLYLERKTLEQIRNFTGALSDQAVAKLERHKISKETDAYCWYSGSLTPTQGMEIANAPAEKREGLARKLAGKPGSGIPMLPLGHIHARAKRWAIKLFLSHYHSVAFRAHFGFDAPKPYILTREGGHAHEIKCPNWPWAGDKSNAT
jgi:hypothetical protein